MNVEKMRAFIIKFIFYCIIIGIVFFVFKYAMPLLMPFLLAFLFAFLLKPIVRKIANKTGSNKKTVSILTMLVFYILLCTLIAVVGTRVVVLVRDVFYSLPSLYTNVIAPAMMEIQTKLEAIMSAVNPDYSAMLSGVGDSLLSAMSSLVTSVSASSVSSLSHVAASVPNMFVNLIITIVASFFLAADYDKIVSFIMRQIPQKNRERIFKAKAKTIDVLFSFLKAYGILMSLTFAELFIGLMLLRIDNALLLALAISLIDILPILGTGTILIPWGVILLIIGNIPLGIGIIVLYLIITVVRQTLEPKVVGQQIGLYPLVTLVCMFVGGSMFGIVGLFGLPICVTVIVKLCEAEGISIGK